LIEIIYCSIKLNLIKIYHVKAMRLFKKCCWCFFKNIIIKYLGCLKAHLKCLTEFCGNLAFQNLIMKSPLVNTEYFFILFTFNLIKWKISYNQLSITNLVLTIIYATFYRTSTKRYKNFVFNNIFTIFAFENPLETFLFTFNNSMACVLLIDRLIK
jgi:hypothetical protein